MAYGGKALMYCAAVAVVLLLIGSNIGWAVVIHDGDPGTIGDILINPDPTTVTLPGVQVVLPGVSGKSFKIKEWSERPSEYPRLVVISTSPLPVKEHWNVTVTGTLHTVSADYGQQRVIITSPSNVYVLCDSKGRPAPFIPVKGDDLYGLTRRPLADLTANTISAQSVVHAMDGGLPPLPDSLDSGTAPTYCVTIADARAAYSPTERILVELQCCPLDNPSSSQFTLGDSASDSTTVYYTNASTLLETDRIVKIVGAIQKDTSNTYWIEVDSGPNWTTGYTAGSVQSVASGTIAWAKTFANLLTLPATLSGKVVSRVLIDEESYYIQEPDRSSGIRVHDPYNVYSVFPGAIVDVDGSLFGLDGERVIEASYTSYPVESTSVHPLFMTNRNLAGGSVDVLTNGAQGASGINNVGLLVLASGKVTHVDTGFLYIDDGSGCADGTQDGGSPPLPISGIRVVGSTQYTPNVGDYIAVTGISGLATYPSGYGRTLRLADPADLTAICPPMPPDGLLATPSSTSTVLLYWNEVPGATGYNVYRGTASGQQGASPVNGLTPVTTRVSPDSDLFTFTDSGLQADTEYYYKVKAITGCGETQPSNEDSATPTVSAIPWEGRDPIAIVAAARACSPEPVACRVDVIGPDRTVYTSEGQVFAAAAAGPPGPEPADVNPSSQGSGQPTQEPNNAHSGPYRKVEARQSYRKITGTAVLPTAVSMNVTPRSYPATATRMKKGKVVPCPSSADIPYVYLGSLGAHLEHVDAGLRYEPSDGMWNMFFLIGPTRTFWVFDPNMPQGADPNEYPTPSNNAAWLQFPRGHGVTLEYWCGKDKDAQNRTVKNGVWLRATGTSGQSAVFAQVAGHPQNGAGVVMKRVSSIGQFLPTNYPWSGSTEYSVGYAKSGSYFLNGEWTSVQVYDMTRAWYVDASHAGNKQEFPVNDANVVTFHLQAPYYWENQINIDLR